MEKISKIGIQFFDSPILPKEQEVKEIEEKFLLFLMKKQTLQYEIVFSKLFKLHDINGKN